MKLCFKFLLLSLLVFTPLFLTAQIPLPEHPRPDYRRTLWQNLNGEWDFKFDQKEVGLEKTWFDSGPPFDKKITVPFPWGSQLSGVEDEAHIGWYKRSIQVSKAWQGKRTFLTIGASDWETSVWLDGQFLGTHQGGYTPFSFDLTPYLRYGSPQNLVIRVDDNAGDPSKFKRGFTLYGKQGYGNARGIWQTVYLEARGKNYLDAIHFTPDIDQQKVRVHVYLDTYPDKEIPLALKIKAEDQTIEHEVTLKPGQKERSFDVAIPDMRLWTLDDPFLYEVDAALGDDLVHTYFGMRKISVENLPGTDFPYIALNNKPVYLQLALDQSYHPGGFYTFPTDAFMKEEILRSKSIGLNGIRVHIKVEVPRKLYWADKLGLLVMEDLPNAWGDPDASMRKESEHTLKQMIKRDYNHPSIFSWVLFNEQWGLHTQSDPEDGKPYERKILPETYNWIASMYYLAKSLDPSRLTEDNSTCCGGVHTATDINSWHVYLPGYVWEQFLKDQTERNFKGSNHLYYEGWQQGNQPFINSECGNVWGYSGSTGDIDWSYDYHRMINSFRKFPEIPGWLYTEHHDVINEWNGYWRFDRSEKFTGLSDIMDGMTVNDFHAEVYLSTGNEICKTVNGGEQLEVPLFLSSMTNTDYGSELTVAYELSHINAIGEEKIMESDEFKIDYTPWMQADLKPLMLQMPENSGLSKLTFKLKTKTGKILQRNFMHFEVESKKTPLGARIISIPVTATSAAQWTQKSWDVLEGKKQNGTGSGYFEYKFPVPNDLNLDAYNESYLIFELSAKALFDKDKTGDYQDAGIDYMKGSIVSPSKNPNAYPMTDETLFSSNVTIHVHGEKRKSLVLPDDPADHRGVLSWHHQITPPFFDSEGVGWQNVPTLSEAGSYGYFVKIDLTKEDIQLAVKRGSLKVRLETDNEGGIAVYGKSFGRYPFNPSLVLN